MTDKPTNTQSPEHNEKKLGMGMILLAWLVVLGMFIVYFNAREAEQYNPNRDRQASVKDGETRLVLQENRNHHYVASGHINGEKVTLLLDTGATSVAIPAKFKQKLKLPDGRESLAYTANGSVAVETTVINELKIGGIKLYNVEATLNPGMNYSNEVLLGMNALKRLNIRFNDGQLTIIQN